MTQTGFRHIALEHRRFDWVLMIDERGFMDYTADQSYGPIPNVTDKRQRLSFAADSGPSSILAVNTLVNIHRLKSLLHPQRVSSRKKQCSDLRGERT